MNKYLSMLGYHGPTTLLALILIMLAVTHSTRLLYLSGLVIAWQIISHLLNITIKNILKAPRPDSHKDPQFINLMPTFNNFLTVHRNFGMPSGHAQAVISEFTFIALYFRNPALTAIAAVQVALTLYQRYAKRRHSLVQLFAGSVIGLGMGVALFILAGGLLRLPPTPPI
jgi:membrane-associated phospholipid phosphatase